jgi:large subunit ribosomal protein L30
MAKKATTIKIIQVRSLIGRPRTQREVVRGLGLRRIRHVVERPDTPAIRGMVAKVPHLVEIVEDKP